MVNGLSDELLRSQSVPETVPILFSLGILCKTAKLLLKCATNILNFYLNANEMSTLTFDWILPIKFPCFQREIFSISHSLGYNFRSQLVTSIIYISKRFWQWGLTKVRKIFAGSNSDYGKIIILIIIIKTNSMAYGTRRFSVAFTRALL